MFPIYPPYTPSATIRKPFKIPASSLQGNGITTTTNHKGRRRALGLRQSRKQPVVPTRVLQRQETVNGQKHLHESVESDAIQSGHHLELISTSIITPSEVGRVGGSSVGGREESHHQSNSEHENVTMPVSPSSPAADVIQIRNDNQVSDYDEEEEEEEEEDDDDVLARSPVCQDSSVENESVNHKELVNTDLQNPRQQSSDSNHAELIVSSTTTIVVASDDTQQTSEVLEHGLASEAASVRRDIELKHLIHKVSVGDTATQTFKDYGTLLLEYVKGTAAVTDPATDANDDAEEKRIVTAVGMFLTDGKRNLTDIVTNFTSMHSVWATALILACGIANSERFDKVYAGQAVRPKLKEFYDDLIRALKGLKGSESVGTDVSRLQMAYRGLKELLLQEDTFLPTRMSRLREIATQMKATASNNSQATAEIRVTFAMELCIFVEGLITELGPKLKSSGIEANFGVALFRLALACSGPRGNKINKAWLLTNGFTGSGVGVEDSTQRQRDEKVLDKWGDLLVSLKKGKKDDTVADGPLKPTKATVKSANTKDTKAPPPQFSFAFGKEVVDLTQPVDEERQGLLAKKILELNESQTDSVESLCEAILEECRRKKRRLQQ
ncbi:hypothetical protein HDV05_006578 [Chytridiales sp. JEL 0842]|nr:hypothetical protein HDV05_006578 [Chytridiales sp. JEL 0842]